MRRSTLTAPLTLSACLLFEGPYGVTDGISQGDTGSPVETFDPSATGSQGGTGGPVETSSPSDTESPTTTGSPPGGCQADPGPIEISTVGPRLTPTALLSLYDDGNDLLLVGHYANGSMDSHLEIDPDHGQCSRPILADRAFGGFVARLSAQGECEDLAVFTDADRSTYLFAAAYNGFGSIVVAGRRGDSDRRVLLEKASVDDLESFEPLAVDEPGSLLAVAFQNKDKVVAAGSCLDDTRRLRIDNGPNCEPLAQGEWFATDLLPTSPVLVAGPYRLQAADPGTGLPMSTHVGDMYDVFVGSLDGPAARPAIENHWRAAELDQSIVSLARDGDAIVVGSRVGDSARIDSLDPETWLSSGGKNFTGCSPGFVTDIATHPGGGWVVAHSNEDGTCARATRWPGDDDDWTLSGGSRPRLAAHCDGVVAVTVDTSGQIVLDFLAL